MGVVEQKVPDGYKMTEVGVIPEDWEVVEINQILNSKPSYGINAAAVTAASALPFYLRITDISDEGKYVPNPPVSVDHAMSDSYILEAGDIVIARTGASVGKSYIHSANNGKLIYAGFLIKLRPNTSVSHPTFLALCLRTIRYWNWISQVSTRSGQPGVNAEQLGSFQAQLPPLPEQTAIATALSDVDGLLAGLDAVLAKRRAVKRAVMQRLLSGEERLEGFDGAWEERQLIEVADFASGKAHEQHIADNGDFVCVNSKFISSSGRVRKYTTLNRLPAEENDILMVMSDLPNGKALAKTYLAGKDESLTVNQRVCRIRPHDESSGPYLSYVLNRNKYFLEFDDGVTQTHLLNPVFQKYKLSLPPLPEQRAIAQVLLDMDAGIAAVAARREKVRMVKVGMMGELLSGRVRLV